jgi:alkyl hydroperoxide reductase subunit AhpC
MASEQDKARFEVANAQVLGITPDSRHTLYAWGEALGGVNYPLLSDYWPHGEVALRFGVLRPDGRAQRSLFLVDEEGIVRYVDVHLQGEQPDPEALFEALAQLR